MPSEKIALETESGQTVEVSLIRMHKDRIDVLIGEEFRCSLRPSRNALAYVGTLQGRELVYRRSVADVEAELRKRDQAHRRIR